MRQRGMSALVSRMWSLPAAKWKGGRGDSVWLTPALVFTHHLKIHNGRLWVRSEVEGSRSPLTDLGPESQPLGSTGQDEEDSPRIISLLWVKQVKACFSPSGWIMEGKIRIDRKACKSSLAFNLSRPCFHWKIVLLTVYIVLLISFHHLLPIIVTALGGRMMALSDSSELIDLWFLCCLVSLLFFFLPYCYS